MGTHEGSVLFKFKGFKRKGVLSVFFGGGPIIRILCFETPMSVQ